MKVLTMYLPQFHRVKENDQWWGEGFTEWTAVKDAQPLFKGHDQPKIPYQNNYYDLLDKDTMRWQSKLMKQYGIYGQVFYHYWFANGRKILEKPAENLLAWEEIDIPFCFSWANESWARSWSNLSNKNTWSSKIETKMEMDFTNGMLLEQAYGDEYAWKEHFAYLLKFFQDKRYIRIEGNPVFIIYKPDAIPCLVRMLDYWRKLAKECGLPGLYVIGVNTEKRAVLDAVLWQEPQATMRNFASQRVIDGYEVWRNILQRKPQKDTFLCGFSGYDDTPRRGEGGKVVTEVSPNDFKEYMMQLMAKSAAVGNEYVFINAWNEWGEGMYLEPDQEKGYQMLEAVKQAEEGYKEISPQTADTNRIIDTSIIARYQSYWHILNKWLTLIESGNTLEEKLTIRGYHIIGLYGLGMLGMHVVRELEGTSVFIKYGIDQRGNDIRQKFPIFKVEDELPEVDAIIVSATYDFGQIYHELKKRTSIPIVSLEEIIGEEFYR